MRWPFRAKDDISALEKRYKSEAFRSAYETALADAVTPAFTAIVVAAIRNAERLYSQNVTKAIPLVDLEALAESVIRAWMPTFTNVIAKSTYDQLAEAIIAARAAGGGVEAVISKARTLFGPERAQRIAVTETTRLFGKASTATYAALGGERWEWQTVRDTFVCSICESRNGEVFAIDESFDPAHVSCRCFPKPS